MSKSMKISVLATSLILTALSSETELAFIDVEVLRETEKAVLVNFKNAAGENTTKTEWLPKKGLTATKILASDVYVVAEWFDHIDGGDIEQTFASHGYKSQIKPS